MSADYTSVLRDLSAKLNKDLRARIAIAGEDINLSDSCKTRIPTTSHMLNLLLGGGVPLGRMMEVFGPPSTGKSTLVQHMMCGFQQYPGLSILIDAENGWERERAIKIGHNNKLHWHLQPDTLEAAFDSIISAVTEARLTGSGLPKDMPIGIFYDTVCASQIECEKEGDRYKEGMIARAKKIREYLRRLSMSIPETNCSIVFVNHEIDGPKGKTTPGGGAIKYWSSKRLKLWSSNRMDYPKEKTGILTQVKNVKDKLNPPHREITLPIRHVTGVDPFYEVLNYLLDNSNYVNKSGSRIAIPDYPSEGKELKAYQRDAPKLLDQYPELIEYLRSCATETWKELNGG